MTPEAAALVAPFVDAAGVSLEVTCHQQLPWQLPELVLHGELDRTSIEVHTVTDGVWTALARQRGQALPLLTINLPSRLSREARAAAVRARLALADAANALPPSADFDAEAVRTLTVFVPIVEGAFLRLARALVAAPSSHDGLRLQARASAGGAVQLVSAFADCAWASYEAELPADHDAALDALWNAAPPGSAELHWHDGSDEWIYWHRPDGTVQADGKLYRITLMHGDDGIDLSAETVLDHVERTVAAAWLQARAAVPMHYVDPHE